MRSGLEDFAPDVDIEAELASAPVADAPAPPAPEPEPVAASEPAPAVSDTAPDKPPPGFVPHGALHEARMQARAAKEQAAKLEADYNAKMERLEKRLELLANPPPPVPKFEDDPANHLRHQVEATQKEIAPLREEIARNVQFRQQQEQEAQLTRVVAAHEAEFQKATPDYLAAVKHLQEAADKNLALNGVEDPQERANIIRRDAMGLAARALQAGRSPAQVVYEMAQNMGYRKAAPNDGVDRIANIEKGQKATPSMPAGGQSAARSALENLASMDDDDVDKLVNDPDLWKKLVRSA